MQTTVGQILINQALPEDMQRHDWQLDKQGITGLFRELAEKHPDRYRDIAQRLMTLGHYNAQAEGTSLRLTDLLPPPEVEAQMQQLRDQVKAISEGEGTAHDKEHQIKSIVLAANSTIEKTNYDAARKGGNSLALQVQSGSRGNASQLKQINVGDMMVEDHRNRVIAVPVLHGYGQGLDPVEYWAGSYGARRGTISTKFAVQDAGFFGKQLALAAHRLTVSTRDCNTTNGMPVEGGDPDNVGSVLAFDVGGHKAGEIITAKMVKSLAGKPVVVRSPITCQAHHGVCAKCAGQREKGRLPDIGDNVGMSAVQAIAEPLSQGMLNAKHGGGSVQGEGKRAEQSGFDYINQLIQVPKSFKGAATVASKSGKVSNLREAPQGGWYADIDGESHYMSPDATPTIKEGDRVDAGDVLSEGTPNPAHLVEHKGIGEGRRLFVQAFGRALAASNVRANRRNVELVARGLINHVRVNDLDGVANTLPDDIVPYDTLAAEYIPRKDSTVDRPHRAVGKYLEQPALHYSIGTKITQKMADELGHYGVSDVFTHKDPPAFTPHMVRGMEIGMNDPNWQTRLAGSYLSKSTLKAVHRGETAPIHDTSYVGSLTEGKDFGKDLKETGLY